MTDSNQGHLLRNIVLFGRLLRNLGLDVTPTQILDLVEALKYIELRQGGDVKSTCRTILVKQVEHLPLFNQAFDLFWQARYDNELAEMSLEGLVQQNTQQKKVERLAPQGDEGDGAGKDSPEADEPLIDKVYTYSDNEVLRQKDFGDLTTTEMIEVKQLLQNMHWNLERRRTRRKTTAPRGDYPDMRRTFRYNLRYGGEPLKFATRTRKTKRRPLVVISDISGSMERYSRILLQFIYVISQGLEGVEAFVFSTRLTRITRYLHGKNQGNNVDAVLDEVSKAIHDWAGGTRIGEAIKSFNYDWGRRVLGQGAIVLIISDGWDRGDVDTLSREMRRLQLSAHRLIWLNPLLGSPNYEPLTRGIVAALPHIDDFLPVHNLVSLEQLGDLLEKLGEYRPERRQKQIA